MTAFRPIALLAITLSAAACQPSAGMSPPAAAASAPSVTMSAPAGLPAFAAPNADQLAFLRRVRGRDSLPAGGPAVIAAWDAPASIGSGNWDYAITAGGRAIEAGGTIRLTDATAAIEAAEVFLLPGEDAPTGYLRLARGWAADAQALDPSATPAIHVYALAQAASSPPANLGQLLPAPVPSGTPAPGPAVFSSVAAGGVLSFYAAGGRIVALRERWAEPPQASEAAVTAAQAAAAVLGAIADPGARSAEAETGTDWFSGAPFTNPDRLPVGCLELKQAKGQTLRV